MRRLSENMLIELLRFWRRRGKWHGEPTVDFRSARALHNRGLVLRRDRKMPGGTTREEYTIAKAGLTYLYGLADLREVVAAGAALAKREQKRLLVHAAAKGKKR